MEVAWDENILLFDGFVVQSCLCEGQTFTASAAEAAGKEATNVVSNRWKTSNKSITCKLFHFQALDADNANEGYDELQGIIDALKDLNEWVVLYC